MSAGTKATALFSVGGFGRDYGSELNGEFMRSGEVDFAAVRENVGTAHVYCGDDDPYVSSDALVGLAVDLGVDPVVVPEGGHLNTEAGNTTFPLLRDDVVALR